MSSNTQIQVASLDFTGIKQNFITYLKSQDTFKDFNFSGSTLSTLLDVLSYNTSYNSFYLNMVANEMFLDSALQRSSVVSHAKMLSYIPKSAIAPVAIISLQFNGVSTSTLTIPQYTNFISGSVDGVNYNYVTIDSTTSSVVGGVSMFNNIMLKQGTLSKFTFIVNNTTNPSSTFEIPDPQIDTSTLQVTVNQSSTNSAYQIFNTSSDVLSIKPTDAVYFLQEAINGNYQIYFGDGVLGKQLTDNSVVNIQYISTSGTSGGGANTFTLMDSVGGSSYTLTPIQAATNGQDRETIDSIKFQAPKSFAAQGRAVSKNDYITAIQQNSLGIQFDAVSVWGGEENIPPAYGQVFIALKPKGAYDLTTTQKKTIISQVLKPISVMTVEPTIVEPDYTYIQLSANVLFQQSQTTSSPSTIQNSVTNALYNYSTTNLNTFNSTFSSNDVLSTISNVDKAIITSDFTINVQKKFYPNLAVPTTYTLYYGVGLKKGVAQSGVTSFPSIQIKDPTNPINTIDSVFIEEVPTVTGGVYSISVLNPGFNYKLTPIINIMGDGVGATATATVINGSISKVTVTNAGTGYTSAIVTVTPAAGDTTGMNGALVINLEGQFGTLRSYYNNSLNAKTVLNNNVGTIDYINGVITLTNFAPLNVDNALGQLTITVQPITTIISSSYNKIITIDPFDPSAVSVSVNQKRN